ncbi:MAG: TraR/DksA C4-type zinc finger protein [Ginsengibacter sp.]
MAVNKTNKGIAKKAITKKPPLKKAVKKAIPLKKAAAKKSAFVKKAFKSIAKKATAGKVKPKTSTKIVKPAKKSAPVKKVSKPIAKKAAAKKLVSKNVASKKPISKKTLVPVKKGITPIDKKHMAVEKHNPKKEEGKKASGKAAETKAVLKAKNIKVPTPPPVVLPKITTTKARKYEPEFTKSVLDQAAPENNGPTHRYSDSELNEFRELIQRKLETAKKELGYLQGLITRKDEMGGDETDNRYMTMEDGSLSMEREQLSQMASRQITFIDHLEKAMMRIENKTYGICRVTGKLIDKARLRAVPHATLSIEAKMGIVK